MATGQGAASKAAGKIETGSYGTPIALDGASETNQLHIISENLVPSHNYESSIHVDGTSGKKSVYPVLNKYAGDLQIEMHYDGITSLLICALGMSNQDLSPVSLGSGAYAHYIEPSADLSERAFNMYEEKAISGTAIRRMTLGFEKQVSIHENASVMINSFAIDVKPDRSTISFNCIPYSQANDSATNGTSANWAKPTADQLTFENAVLYLKARDLFTVNSGVNDTLRFTAPSGYNATMSSGTYTGEELVKELAAKMTATSSSGKFEGKYNGYTRKFEIKSTNGVSFSLVWAHVSTTCQDLFGAIASTGTGLSFETDSIAQPDVYAAFATADKVGVSSFSLSYANGLAGEDQDSLSGSKIIEPERNELRTVSGNIEIPRYKDDTWMKAVNGGTVYEGLLKFTGSTIGGGNNQEFNLYLPHIIFDNGGAPIAGAGILNQSLSFQCAFPDHLDFTNFWDDAYFMQEDFFSTTAASVLCLEPYKDGLYFADLASADIMKFTKEAGPVDTGLNVSAGSIVTMKAYNSNLYIGLSGGKIDEFDGSASSLSCDTGTGDVSAMEVFGSNLYALEKTTGRVNTFDGTTWSLSCDTTSVTATDLIAFGGYLWVYGSDGINADIQRFDGTTWTTAASNLIADVNASGGFIIHDGELWLGAAGTLHRWNDSTSTFDVMGTIPSGSVGFIASFQGELIVANTSTALYLFNSDSATATTIKTMASATYSKPAYYEGNLFFGTVDSAAIMKPVKEIYLKLHNETSANPL